MSDKKDERMICKPCAEKRKLLRNWWDSNMANWADECQLCGKKDGSGTRSVDINSRPYNCGTCRDTGLVYSFANGRYQPCHICEAGKKVREANKRFKQCH